VTYRGLAPKNAVFDIRRYSDMSKSKSHEVDGLPPTDSLLLRDDVAWSRPRPRHVVGSRMTQAGQCVEECGYVQLVS
jgi:hypothetical protein